MGPCRCSDQKSNSSGKESVPANLEEVLELLVSGKEGRAVNIAVVLDLTVNLICKECLHSVVELEFPEVGANIPNCEVGPVGMLNSVKETVVVGNPQTVLEGVKVNDRVQGFS
jgi:hypothetical protein